MIFTHSFTVDFSRKKAWIKLDADEGDISVQSKLQKLGNHYRLRC